jgi:predicted Rossmann fold flavoprotein
MVKERIYDFAIIGAGAAGLSAAISFGRKAALTDATPRFILFDGNTEAGKKILATGNGRCNLTNVAAEGYRQTRSLFESLGILLETDAAGRVYPRGRQARTVRDVLADECGRLGARLALGMRVLDIRKEASAGYFTLVVRHSESREVEITAERVLIATGGKSTPAYGNLGDGFAFARKLGHSVNGILPALVPMLYAQHARALMALKGVRAPAAVALYRGDARVASAEGEVQFTEDGLSGICIFDLSRFMRREPGGADTAPFSVRIDFLPEVPFTELAAFLEKRGPAGLSGVVNSKVAAYMNKVLADVPGAGSKAAASLLKGFEVPVSGTKGWKAAQITAGGVPLAEVDSLTCASKKVPGLFFAGEVLDYDGPSGGFNLNFAWVTGMKAGLGAANS